MTRDAASSRDGVDIRNEVLLAPYQKRGFVNTRHAMLARPFLKFPVACIGRGGVCATWLIPGVALVAWEIVKITAQPGVPHVLRACLVKRTC